MRTRQKLHRFKGDTLLHLNRRAGGDEGGMFPMDNQNPQFMDTMAIRNRKNGRRSKRPNPQRLDKAVCAGCGKEVRLEVSPPIDQKLFCLDCYKKQGEVIHQISLK